MIFITAKFHILPEHADAWPEISAEFTEATRAEPGCLWFDWSRSLADPAEYVLVEAFRDGEAGGAHVQSEHFKKAQRTLPPFLVPTPKIVNTTVPADHRPLLVEMAVPEDRSGGATWSLAAWMRGLHHGRQHAPGPGADHRMLVGDRPGGSAQPASGGSHRIRDGQADRGAHRAERPRPAHAGA